MPVDDRTRLNLHRKLDTVLGPEEADTLMAHLPPVTWNDVATKDDIGSVRTEMQALERTLRSEMQTGFAELRGEMQAGFAQLRGEMQAGDSSLRGAISDAITTQTKWMTTVVVAWSALLLTAVRYLP